MPDVKIYSADYCSYCQEAKKFFAERGIPFEEIDVTRDLPKREWLKQVTNRQTLPQIFIQGVSMGGYTDLLELEKNGRLSTLLGESR